MALIIKSYALARVEVCGKIILFPHRNGTFVKLVQGGGLNKRGEWE